MIVWFLVVFQNFELNIELVKCWMGLMMIMKKRRKYTCIFFGKNDNEWYQWVGNWRKQ